MRLTTIYETANEIAPFSLSEEYCSKFGAHDNSGVQVDCGNDIKKILFSLDLSAAAIERAEACGADCIFTHHPAIFYPLSSLAREGAGRNVLRCAAKGLSVLSAHLNLDCAAGGIDDCLMYGLGGSAALAVMHPLSSGGYGKCFAVDKRPLKGFAEEIKKNFSTDRVLCYGSAPVSRVASFCGAGMDGDSVAFALKNGADTFVSSDPKHHLVAELTERGVNVVLITHYAAENYGFYQFYQKIKERLSVACEYFTDERLL